MREPLLRARPTRRGVLTALPLVAASPAVLRALTGPASDLPRLPFLESERLPPGRSYGEGLDGRLAYDLTRVQSADTLAANVDFYVRTKAPAAVAARTSLDDWVVRMIPGGDASGHQVDFSSEAELGVASLRERARPQGVHLLECSGNSSRAAFGLLSAAEWSGVRLDELFQEFFWNLHSTTLVEVVGNDTHARESRSSVMGASWIFRVAQLREAGAFLATEMNGEPLPLDHGAPVRLIVPNWYGCTCIKWVEEIRVVPFNAPSSSQMREFASRTHQEGQPELASDYAPATLDFTALVTDVRGPDAGGDLHLRGISWGDATGVQGLRIGLESDEGAEQWATVTDFTPPDRSQWSTWSLQVRPTARGRIRLRATGVSDGPVRTRRLDRGYYARSIQL